MNEKLLKNFHLLCRTCLLQLSEDCLDTGKHDIFHTPDLMKQIMLTTNLPVENDDGLPCYLCDKCYQLIKNFHKFLSVCTTAKKKLDEMLQSIQLQQQLSSSSNHEKIEMSQPLLDSITKTKVPQQAANTATDLQPTATHISSNDVAIKEEPSQQLVSNEEDESSSDESYKHADSEDEWEMQQQSKQKKNSSAAASKSKKPKDKQSHNEVPMFPCSQCSRKFFKEHRMIAHRRTVHEGLAPYECSHEGCKRTFKRLYRLQDHMNIHLNKEFPCTYEGCGKVYKNRSILYNHFRLKHVPTCQQPPKESNKNICEICGFISKNNTNAKQHRLTHMGKEYYPFVCEVLNCGARFLQNSKLNEHMLRHKGIKNFVCNICGLKQISMRLLNKHMNVHTKEKQFPCPFCKMVFNATGNLKRHQRIVHEQRRDFACQYCERKFTKKETCRYHEMTHTGEKPLECPECSKRFIQPIALKTHRKIHYRNGEQIPVPPSSVQRPQRLAKIDAESQYLGIVDANLSEPTANCK